MTFLDSTKAGVKFCTPKLEGLSADHAEVTKQYDAQQQYIVDEILELCFG